MIDDTLKPFQKTQRKTGKSPLRLKNFRLPLRQVEWLVKEARVTGRTQVKIIEYALDHYAKWQGRPGI